MPHTAQTLAHSALVATRNKRVALHALGQPAVNRLAAIDYAVTATLEEFEDRSMADLKLTLESLVVLASGEV